MTAEKDYYTQLAEGNSYMELRTKALVVHSYADGYNVHISEAEEEYALYNPPSQYELDCLQSAKERGLKGQALLEAAITESMGIYLSDDVLEELLTIGDDQSPERIGQIYQGLDDKRFKADNGQKLSNVAQVDAGTADHDTRRNATREDFFSDTLGNYCLCVAESDAKTCGQCANNNGNVYHTKTMRELYGDPKTLDGERDLFHKNCRCRLVLSSVSQGEKLVAVAEAALLQFGIDAHQKKESKKDKKYLHDFLDVVGAIPVVGEVADLINGTIHLIEGDYKEAAVSYASAVLIGEVTKGMQTLKRGRNAYKGVKALDSIDDVLVKSGKGERIFGANKKVDAIKAIDILPSEIQHKAKSFFKRSSHAYNDFSVELLENGNYKVQMTKPGDVPGSKAIYLKEIDADGKTVKVYKETYTPEGELVHIKDKGGNMNGTQ